MSFESIINYIGQIFPELVKILPGLVWLWFIAEAVKCLLRSEMLRIYYHNKDAQKIRQYELQNFLHLYSAYRLLLGNSFIKEIHDVVITWEVVT